jgi:hypothetical protein
LPDSDHVGEVQDGCVLARIVARGGGQVSVDVPGDLDGLASGLAPRGGLMSAG